jgi:hypothetical protein
MNYSPIFCVNVAELLTAPPSESKEYFFVETIFASSINYQNSDFRRGWRKATEKQLHSTVSLNRN